MYNLNRTFSTKNGITIKSGDGSTFCIYSGDISPEQFDDGSIPISSLYSQSNGKLFQKQLDSTWKVFNDNINNSKAITLEPIVADNCCSMEFIETNDGDIITGELG